MRRVFVLLFCLLPLLLFSCAKPHTMRADADGFGYTDRKSGVHYAVLSTAFTAASKGEKFAESEKGALSLEFYTVANADPALWLTDQYLHLYYSGEGQPDIENAAITAILVCVRDAIAVEFSRVEDVESIAAWRAVWFGAGETAELPPEKAAVVRTLQCVTAEYPMLYYCVSFYRYEGGDAYCFDRESGRVVRLSPELANTFVPAEAMT